MKIKTAIIGLGLTLGLGSCHNPVWDDEGDCEVNYYLSFVYDMNLKWADAFPSEVHSVNLYVFDSKGLYVTQFSASGEEVDAPGYLMKLELEPGDYQFVAWCGLVNDGETSEQFSLTDLQPGVTTIGDFDCSLRTQSDHAYPVYSEERLYFLYHGYLSETLPDAQDGIDRYYTMYLTKDTNHIRVMLQQLNENLEADALEVILTAANGVMDYDNSLLGNTEITYLPWEVQSDVLGYGGDMAGEDGKEYTGIIADLSTCRLMADAEQEVWLTVTRVEDGKVIANIPFVQYSLIGQSYYETAYGHQMTAQEFLDRQDEYVLTIFLDENMRWLYTELDILEWRVVIQRHELGEL